MRLIQKELNQVKREWNLHRMQRSRFQEGMSGKPDVIFSSPVAYGIYEYNYKYLFKLRFTVLIIKLFLFLNLNSELIVNIYSL